MAIALEGGSVWAVRQRSMVGGLDQALLARVRKDNLGTFQNLALVGDRMGSTVAAIKEDGSMEGIMVVRLRAVWTPARVLPVPRRPMPTVVCLPPQPGV